MYSKHYSNVFVRLFSARGILKNVFAGCKTIFAPGMTNSTHSRHPEAYVIEVCPDWQNVYYPVIRFTMLELNFTIV